MPYFYEFSQAVLEMYVCIKNEVCLTHKVLIIIEIITSHLDTFP